MTKNLERKKKGQRQGRTNRRMPICNPTIQLVLVDLYTKYEVSILNGCGDIFDEKVLRNYGRTDGTTDRCKPVYPPLFQSGGRGDQIFFSATCPGQVACKNPLVLRNFLLVPKYFSNRKSIGQVANTTISLPLNQSCR